MKKIKILLKNNRIIYWGYNLIVSFILKIFSIFIKTDNMMILFNSYGGQKYDDSPKAIYEYMLKSKKYNNYKMIWAIDNPNLLPRNTKYVKNNSIVFFITALKSKYWVTNSSIERGLKFKQKNTIYINTWHGSAFKFMGNELKSSNTKFRVSKPDYFYAQSKYDVDVFSKAYDLNNDIIKIWGLPRNDELCCVNEDKIKKIKKSMNLPLEKKIILFAPTFREYDYTNDGCFIAPPIDIKKWEKLLSNEYIVLFRAHYEINKVLNIKDNSFIYNMTDYPKLNDLMIISDILISDYSSIMIDYSILERPIFCYAYDYEEYCKKRGLYVDLNKELPNGICLNEDKLLLSIKNCDYKIQSKKTKKFKSKFVEKCGDACSSIDKIIKKEK